MSNGGLDKALEYRLLRSKVGDKYVAEMMREANADIGGESSGHMLSLMVCRQEMDFIPPCESFRVQDCLLGTMPDFHDGPVLKMRSATEEKKIDLEVLNSIQEAKDDGHRLVVRYSGTEPKIRILVEGERAEHWCAHISTGFKTR